MDRDTKRVLLAIVAAAIFATAALLAAWRVAQSTPIPPPTSEVNPPVTYWKDDPAVPGSELVDAGPIVGLTFRVEPRSFDPRADRIYVAMPSRIYALDTDPNLGGQNSWGIFNYLNVSSDAPRTATLPPLVVNYGGFQSGVADAEGYIGTSDGTLFLFRDRGNVVPDGPNLARLSLGSPITGLAAYNGDLDAPLTILGTPSHMWYDGARWAPESIQGFDDAGEYASLAIAPSGDLYLAYYDVFDGAPHVAVRTTSWTTMPPVEPFSSTIDRGTYTSLAVGSDGLPRLAYYDETASDLRFAAWDGSAWNASVVDPSVGVGRFASLALNASNLPSIAYFDASGGSLRLASSAAPGVWSIESVDSGGLFASLALTSAGEPRIAYFNTITGELRYAAKSAGSWTIEVADGSNALTNTSEGRQVSLALDPSGAPRIAFRNARFGHLDYATKSGGRWTVQTVDANGDVGSNPSIAINPSGQPEIAYGDAGPLDLKYARWTGTQWQVETLRSEGNVGLYNSLAFDSAGRPHIGSYSMTTGRTGRDLLVVGTADGMVRGIDVSIPGLVERSNRQKQVATWNYRVRWAMDAGAAVHLAQAPLRRNGAIPLFSPAFSADGGIVFVGLASSTILAIGTADGSVSWQASIPGVAWGGAPVAFSVPGEPPAAEQVLAGGSDGTVSIFDAGNGQTLGSRTVTGGVADSPDIIGNQVFVPSSSGELLGLSLRDPVSGAFLTQVWKQLLAGPPSGMWAAENQQLVAVADGTGRLYSFRFDGRVNYRTHLCDAITAGPVIWQPPRSVGPHVWIGCRDGTVMSVGVVGQPRPVP